MTNIKGSKIHDKIRELIPTLPKIISSEALDKLCEDNLVQTFFKWFYENINHDNILTDDCIKLKNQLQKINNWFQGTKLDITLSEEVADCPELLKIIELNCWNNQVNTDYENEKELYDQDYEYLRVIENSLNHFQNIEEQLINNLDKEDDNLKNEEIKAKLVYDNCMSVLEEFHSCHQQFYGAVDLLAHTYSNAIHQQEEFCLWTQMPMELYIKQLETYHHYLSDYGKRQFSTNREIGERMKNSSDFCELSKNKKILQCKKNLYESKVNEISAKIEDHVSDGVSNYAKEIFNQGNIKAPTTPFTIRTDIAELTKSRDFLEENINLLKERQLTDTVQKFSQAKIISVLIKEAETRLHRRKEKLLRLKRLCTLAKEHGYVFATLMCMLLELQIHKVDEIVQFVMDARHYLSKEFSLSLLRNENMQEIQNSYASILKQSHNQNAFYNTLMEMSTLESKDNIHTIINHYDELKNDNFNKLKIIFDEKLLGLLYQLQQKEIKVYKFYQQEINSSPTLTFSEVPCEILNNVNKIIKQVKELENNTESMKIKLKNMIKETNNSNFEREKLLIWQKFLADSQALRDRYEELELLGEQCCVKRN